MLENRNSVKSRNRRVVNGVNVQDSWEWIVRLDFFTEFNDKSSLCGGTVIHRNYVLTAAHCCEGKNSVLMTFKENKLKNFQDIKKHFKVSIWNLL